MAYLVQHRFACTRTLVPRWLLLTVHCLLVLSISLSCKADQPSMRFVFADGSEIQGRLAASQSAGQLRIQSALFTQPINVATEHLLEGRREEMTADPQPEPEASGQFAGLAIRLNDGSQFNGTIESVTGQQLSIMGGDLGTLHFAVDRITSITQQAIAARQLLSMAGSKYRFRREDGWKFDGDALVCDVPESAVVGELDLPNRFSIHLQVRCDGEADFELSLGDRSIAGAGQGSGRVDRKGGSLSRLPTERFVTRIEWFGDSVSLVRSNASVSDSDVCPLPPGKARLDIDVFIDQDLGRLAVYCSGALLGEVALVDDQPIIRRMLTLINRRDPVVVNQLQLYQWDGRLPESRAFPDRFTLLRDGNLLEDVAVELESDRFRVGQDWYPWTELSRMEFARQNRDSIGCEFTFANGSRFRGLVDEPESRNAQADLDNEAAGKVRLRDQDGQVRFSVVPRSIIRVVGRAVDLQRELPVTGELVAAGLQMRGNLLSGNELGTTFGWRAEVSPDELGMVETPGVEVRFPARPQSDPRTFPHLELRSGDLMPGELIGVDAETVRLKSVICGEVAIPAEQVRRVRLAESVPLDATDLQAMLSLPRSLKRTPPTHLLVSPEADVLRGKLLSIDQESARLEVRGRMRVVPRDRIAEVIWLGDREATPDPCRYVVTTSLGAVLGLGPSEFDGAELRGAHAVLGDCRIKAEEIRSLRFGPRGDQGGASTVAGDWKLVPVKEPKTFE